MRGLPPFQALIILITLAVLGFAGSHYVDMKEPTAISHTPPSQELLQNDTIEAEIEFVFSSPPVSYSLKKLSADGTKDEIVFRSPPSVENPSYHDISLTPHTTTTYWLDIVWQDDAKENANHFAQINISPSHGARLKVSFFSDSREMNETFEYIPEKHHHE